MNQYHLSQSEATELNARLETGVVNRMTNLSLLFVGVFFAYSFTSLSFIQVFDPSVHWFDNTWPRVLFNVIPLLSLYLFFRAKEPSSELKMWVWAIGLPLIFSAACMVNVWRIMLEGKGDIYLYVHSANTFILVTSIVVVSPPMRIVAAQMASFALLLVAPIGYIMHSTGKMELLKFSMGDYMIAIPVVVILGNTIYRLRYKIARLDMRTKKQATAFLGAPIARAIYENKAELLADRKAYAIVMQMDIRSFTAFYNSNDQAKVKRFMVDYHSLVGREIGRFGGYLHKSVGDSHIISFGAIENEDLLGIVPAEELHIVEEKRKASYARMAESAWEAIARQFEALKERHGVADPIAIGAAIDYGEVEVRVQGDESYRRELDIDGNVLIRCARLEEFTKDVRKHHDLTGSLLVVSPELELSVPLYRFISLNTSAIGSVRDYPEVKKVLCRYLNGSAAKGNIKAVA